MKCVDCGRPIKTPTPDPFRCESCRLAREFGVTRVTDFRVDRVSIREADYWNLPERTRRLIETYGSQPMRIVNGNLEFEMSIERWPEIEASMRALTGTPK